MSTAIPTLKLETQEGGKGYRVMAVAYDENEGILDSIGGGKKDRQLEWALPAGTKEVIVISHGKQGEYGHGFWRNDSKKKDLRHDRLKGAPGMLQNPLSYYATLSDLAKKNNTFQMAKFTLGESATAETVGVGTATQIQSLPQQTTSPIQSSRSTLTIATDYGIFDPLGKKDFVGAGSISLSGLQGKAKARLDAQAKAFGLVNLDNIQPVIFLGDGDFLSARADPTHRVKLYGTTIKNRSSSSATSSANQQPTPSSTLELVVNDNPISVERGNWFERRINDAWDMDLTEKYHHTKNGKKENEKKKDEGKKKGNPHLEKHITDNININSRKGMGKIEVHSLPPIKKKGMRLQLGTDIFYLREFDEQGTVLAELPIIVENPWRTPAERIMYSALLASIPAVGASVTGSAGAAAGNVPVTRPGIMGTTGGM